MGFALGIWLGLGLALGLALALGLGLGRVLKAHGYLLWPLTELSAGDGPVRVVEVVVAHRAWLGLG